MTLNSPGVQISVTDESVHSSSGQGTVPLLIIATATNKLTPDGSAVASGTTDANAGKLNLITSQRELLQTYGIPFFESSEGTIIQGSEVSEYGLFSAYSYLGIANRAYVLRASVDLSQLIYRQDPPSGDPVNGSYWFDLTNTKFGIFRANGSSTPGLAWDSVNVLIPVGSEITGGDVPDSSFGDDGDVAVVTTTTNNFIYEKIDGSWYAIGTTGWKAARPTIALGSVTTPSVTNGDNLTLNGSLVTFGGTSLSSVVTAINNASISGISASTDLNKLKITLSTGEDLTISSTGTALTDLGLSSSYVGYHLNFATHVNIPVGTHSGDFWVKTTNPNFGANYIVKRFNSSTGQFAAVSTPLYSDDTAADTAYGSAKAIGSLYAHYNSTGDNNDPIADSTIVRWDGSNWTTLSYVASTSAPTTSPAEGTIWISDEFKVDIMVNDGSQWRGYGNIFPDTDETGVLITSAEPTTQVSGDALVEGDLWLDSSDLTNYPALSRFNGTEWVLIDKTDQTTPFGIVFADARPNEDGTEDGSTDIAAMLTSDFVDPDAPNPETYPAGVLLFNTRFSTYNVKSWKPNALAFLGDYTVGGFEGSALEYFSRWVSVSGNQTDGSPFMGRFAQRQVVIESLASAIVSNEDIRSEFVNFNLIAASGYPELIDEMIGLNVDRKETAFIITDTPMRLKPDGTSINNWATNHLNRSGTDEFGRTNRYTYSAEYYPQGLSTDLSGNAIVVPASTIALRTYAYNDSVAYPWFPPAGTQRGIVSNASSVGYITDEGEFQAAILNQGQRDTLYTNNINPIAFLPNRGLIVYGDKTLHPEETSLDRVNVARLICYLRTQLDQLAQPFLFQLNTDSTRQAAQSLFSRYLSDLIAVNAITDYICLCDSSNNSPAQIDANELHIDLAIVPQKSINFIYIPIRLVNTGDI